jgi:hypothetical protein
MRDILELVAYMFVVCMNRIIIVNKNIFDLPGYELSRKFQLKTPPAHATNFNQKPGKCILLARRQPVD